MNNWWSNRFFLSIIESVSKNYPLDPKKNVKVEKLLISFFVNVKVRACKNIAKVPILRKVTVKEESRL